jgi:T5SS/PEP-CTERM-associated repeat protein
VYAGNLNVGVAGSFNSFSASAGKSLNFVLSVGTSGGSHNSATITGTGTYLFSSSYISAGDDGVSNSITFSDGAVADSIHGLIGGTSDSDNNSILVTGAGTRWNCADLLSVGYGGIGDAPEGNTLTIADGAMVVVGRAGEGTVDGDKVRVGEGNYLRLDQTSTLALLGDIDDTGTYSQESLLPFFMVDMGAGWEAADASDLIFSYHAEEYLGLTGYTFITVVPEPSSYAIFGGLAAAGLALARRRRSVAS